MVVEDEGCGMKKVEKREVRKFSDAFGGDGERDIFFCFFLQNLEDEVKNVEDDSRVGWDLVMGRSLSTFSNMSNMSNIRRPPNFHRRSNIRTSGATTNQIFSKISNEMSQNRKLVSLSFLIFSKQEDVRVLSRDWIFELELNYCFFCEPNWL
ncbi:unnamed protein product [Vicia faba]|uniref:Uncharacterized protein n=1 Tax=Vicia faba TaxID=3906 RepID=A0AAV1ARY5_VICFA|nr:unnamed protein product [Vicia faba]